MRQTAIAILLTSLSFAIPSRAGIAPVTRQMGVDQARVWLRHSGRQGGDPAAEWLGKEIAAGDFNGDGRQDIAIAAHYDSLPTDEFAGRGIVYVYFGRGGDQPALLDPCDRLFDCRLAGTESFAYFGTELIAGDFDGDGLDDLAVSQVELTTQYRGSVFVVSGAMMTVEPELRMDEGDYLARMVGRPSGGEAGQWLFFGFALTSGDFNADGVDDLAIGAFGGDGPGGTRGEAGEVAVYLGHRGVWTRDFVSEPTATDLFVYGRIGLQRLGNELGAGDLDGDGRDELLIASWGANGPNGDRSFAGSVSVLSFGAGSPVLLPVPVADTTSVAGLIWDMANPGPSALVHGPAGNARIGASASDGGGRGLDVGDFDGDGFNDVLIGAPFLGERAVTGKNQGYVYVVWGDPNLTRKTVIDLAEASSAADSPASVLCRGIAGDSLADTVRVGDITGDGRADLVAGAPDGAAELGYAAFYAGRPRSLMTASPMLTEPDGMIVGQLAGWRAGEDAILLDSSFAGTPLLGATSPVAGKKDGLGRGTAGEVALFPASTFTTGVAPAPYFQAPALVEAAISVPLSITVDVAGGTGGIAAVTAALPSFATLQSLGGGRYLVTATPAITDRGRYLLALTAVDAAGVSAVRKIMLVVGFKPVVTGVKVKKTGGTTGKITVDGVDFSKGDAQILVDGLVVAPVKYPTKFDSNGGVTVTRLSAKGVLYGPILDLGTPATLIVYNPVEGLYSEPVTFVP